MPIQKFSIERILELSGGRLANADALGSEFRAVEIRRMAPLDEAGAGDLAFFFSKKYQNELLKGAPSALITAEPFVLPLEKSGLAIWRKTAIISCADPYYSMALLSSAFAETASTVAHLRVPESGMIHSTAVVDGGVDLGAGVRIGPHCVVEEGAKIGKGTVLYPGCFIGPNVTIGAGCVLFPRVTIYENAQIGDRVRIHAGVVIGADGFGYAPKMKEGKLVAHQKIFHLGRVLIGSDTEIGANTCIDRGTLKDTVIGPGCKIDDHVMIGHNCQMGEGVIVCGSVGIAGSAEIGNFVYVGGLSGIPNGVKIGDGAKLGGGTFVSGDIAAGETVGGHPHRKFRDFLKVQVLLNRMLKDGKQGSREGKRSGGSDE